jgi:outer membrane protein assembly factor BamA
MKRLMLVICLVAIYTVSLVAQDADSTTKVKKEKIKDGFSFGGVPVVAYDADVGFKYGALVNLYWYDSLRYPMYDHSIYLEWSRTTRGNGINQITYDSDRLIPGIRSFLEFSYLTEKALDFYGYNGYQAVYDLDFEQNPVDDMSSPNRLYYRHARQLLRIKADFQGEIIGQKFRWLAGIAYYGNKISAVDVDDLTERKDPADMLSSNSLYQDYVDWGVIKADQAEGGNHTLLKAGLVYDTRDNEPNPFRGIWTEMQLHYAPSFLSNRDYSFARLVVTHRQYFTLIPEWMSMAYRLSYQGKIAGEMPFYMLPYLYNTAPKLTSDGVGGGKTVRGVRRNRIVGDGFAYGNLELRGKVVRGTVLNQNVYIALSAFADAGMVTQKYKFDAAGIPQEPINSQPGYEDKPERVIDMDAKEVPHLGFGAGFHLAINQNFIITVDYGFAAKKEDGDTGLYINLNFLF